MQRTDRALWAAIIVGSALALFAAGWRIREWTLPSREKVIVIPADCTPVPVSPPDSVFMLRSTP